MDKLIDHSIFREYDIRGVVDDTLREEDARAIGRAFGTLIRENEGKSVCLAYDGRLSSVRIAACAGEGLMAAGIDVTSVGCGPTPLLYHATIVGEFDAGIMITGSHNPSDYNGFKMTLGGKPFFGSDIQELVHIIERGHFAVGDGRYHQLMSDKPYLDDLLTAMSVDLKLKVAWDPGNGAAGDVLKQLVARLPGEHIIINGEIDGHFPNHHPDPTEPENLVQLTEVVSKHGCDLGIAFDGDGDRLGVIDAQGRILWGDQLLMLFAADVLQDQPGATIIADVKASQALFDEIKSLGGNGLMWRTGHSLIKTKIAETGAPLAGEMSGHIFFADRYYGFDDAIYAAVRLLDLVSRKGGNLALMHDTLPSLVNTPEIRIDCADERKFKIVAQVQDQLKAMGADVNEIDGVRVNNADGWWLLRASNTQPVLVARCEASSAEGLERLKETLAGHLGLCGVIPRNL